MSIEEPLIIRDLRENASAAPIVEPAAGGRAPLSAISVVVHCDGERFGTLCALSPEPDRFDPHDAVFLQTVADLLSAVIESERHKAASREMQARYERIAANTPGMVYQSIRHADGTATVPFISEGCRQLYGLEPAELTARPELMNSLIHPADQPGIYALLDASNAALTPLAWEGRLVHPSGEIRWVAARSPPRTPAQWGHLSRRRGLRCYRAQTRAGGGREGQPRQERVSLPHQPRAAHAAQRHSRLWPATRSRAARRAPAHQCRADPQGRQAPARSDQRSARYHEHRVRWHGPVDRTGASGTRARGGVEFHPPLGRAAWGAARRRHRGRRRGRAGRPRPVASGFAQPAVQRSEIQSCRWRGLRALHSGRTSRRCASR